jgi:hypothetical protein
MEPITERYPLGGLLTARTVTGDLIFFRIIGHTSQKVRVHQIIPKRRNEDPHGKPDTVLLVNDTCRLVDPLTRKSRGLAKVLSDGRLIWNCYYLTLFSRNDFDGRVDVAPW